jgi:Protein of unknown function (DUF2939)
MRTTLLTVGLVAAIWLALAAWPIQTVSKLAHAVETGDVATVVAHVDFASLRASLTEQVGDSYLRLTGIKISPLARGLATAAAGSVADPVIARIVTPEALTDLLKTGWPNAVAGERPPGTIGLSVKNVGTAWQIFASADYGLRRFLVFVPPSFAPEHRFGLEFRLSQWRWQLTGVRLPEPVSVALAEVLSKSLPKPPR